MVVRGRKLSVWLVWLGVSLALSSCRLDDNSVRGSLGDLPVPPTVIEPLGSVSNLKVTASTSTSIAYSWDPLSGATGYKVSYGPTSEVAPDCSQGQDIGSATSYTIEALPDGAVYALSVCPYNGHSEGSPKEAWGQSEMAFKPLVSIVGNAKGGFAGIRSDG